MTSERNIQDTPCNEDSCDVTAFQEIDVCVPITVEPYVDLGEPIIECIEEPCLVPIPCGAWNKKKGKCRFTICQKLSIMIPIEFKAEALSGPPSVNCSGGGEEEDEEEGEWPPYICCGQGERLPFVSCEEEQSHGCCEKHAQQSVCCEREEYYQDICCEKGERPPFVCCEKRECEPKISDFYYFVRGRRGRLKK